MTAPARHPIDGARAARRSKAEALATLADGSLTLSEALRAPPAALSGVDLYDVLMRCPSLGRESVRQVCERSGVWPHLRMGELAPEQRAAVVLALPPRLRVA